MHSLRRIVPSTSNTSLDSRRQITPPGHENLSTITPRQKLPYPRKPTNKAHSARSPSPLNHIPPAKQPLRRTSFAAIAPCPLTPVEQARGRPVRTYHPLKICTCRLAESQVLLPPPLTDHVLHAVNRLDTGGERRRMYSAPRMHAGHVC